MALKVPSTYNQVFGTLKARKGNLGDKMVMTWDSVPQCKAEDCASHVDCFFFKNNTNPNHSRCQVMSNYLRGVYTIMITNYDLTEPELMRVGMHLIPLYKNLCRLQIEEHGIRELVRPNKAGNLSVHPLYDQIRNYILAIDRLWSAMNFDKTYKGNGKSKKALGHPSVDDIINGDPDYYESLNDDENATSEAP